MEPVQQKEYANGEQVDKVSSLLSGQADNEKKEGQDDDSESKIEHGEQNEKIEHDQNEQQEQKANDEQGEQAKAVNFKELAEKFNMEPKDLYELEVGIGAGEVTTIGRLKDNYKEYQEIKAGQDDFETSKTNQQNEMMVARRQLEQVITLANSTGQLTPELLGHIDGLHRQNMTRERNALMKVIPEWKDETTRQNDLNSIVDVLSKYGFSRIEVESVVDHRLLKLVHDMAKRNNLIEDAKKKNAPKVTGKNSNRYTGDKKTKQIQQNIQDAKNGTHEQKLNAVSQLILQ